jgi:hypothetical protein
MKRLMRLGFTVFGSALVAATAHAQPKLVLTSAGDDLTADGNTAIGTILDANVNGQVVTYTRGVGFAQWGPPIPWIVGQLQIADDRSAASFGTSNGLSGPLNPPFGEGLGVAYRYVAATNTLGSIGSFPNIGGFGAAECGDISTPYGMSSTGRFVSGSGWYGPYGTTACDLRGFVYDANSGTMKQLPPVGTGCQVFSQAEFVSTNGLVVMGSDSHESPDASTCNARCVTVWERTSDTAEFLPSGRTVLDGWGAGGLSSAAMNRAGTIVAAGMSDGQAAALGNSLLSRNLFKYVKNTTTGAWDRINLGTVADRDGGQVACIKPSAISDDGNTIIGTAYFFDCGFFGLPRAFIWRPSINEGVPMDFEDYLRSINGGQPFPATGAIVDVGPGMSADGNAMLVRWQPPAPSQCGPDTGLVGLPRAGILYLNGSGIACDPPRIAGGPYSVIQEEYTRFGIVGNVFVSGSYPMSAQWQKETPAGSNNWVNLTDSCGTFDGTNGWVYEGTTGFQLRINMLAPPQERDGRFRVVITNSCGSATSSVATIGVVSGACCYSDNGPLVCTVEMPSRCTNSFFLNGIYLGNGVACQPATCDAVSGACCVGGGGANATCTVTLSTQCESEAFEGGLGGTFVGTGTTCGPTACASVSGACCYSTNNTSDVICTSEVRSHCTRSAEQLGLSGAFVGLNSTCTPTACSTVAGACCYAADSQTGVICSIQTQTRCTNLPSNPSVPGYINGLQGIYVGHGTTCQPVSQQCGFVAGACCYSVDDTSSAICTLQLQDRCTRAANNNGLGGVYRGDGTVCGPTSCTNFTGACCYSTFDDPATLLCTIQPQVRCTDRFYAGGLFGIYRGAGTTCSPTACTTVVGACCAFDNSGCLICVLAPGVDRCTEPFNGGLGGTYSGDGTVCGPTSCPSSGACCLDGQCTLTCESICQVNSGTFLGVGSVCTGDPCNPSNGACCRGSTCAVGTAATCTGANTLFAGAGTVCNAFGGNTTTPCCLADYNHVGGVTVQDIFDFLSGYFTLSPNADINGSGAVSVQDIFDFLSVYFAGC